MAGFWLALACLLDFGFAQLFKAAQRVGARPAVVVSTNYLTLSAALAIFLAVRGQLALTGGIAMVGVVAGCVFICSMTIMTRSLERANVAVVLTAFRMAIVVPIVAGVLIWSEPVGSLQLLGLLLAIVGLFLITRGAKTTKGKGVTLPLLVVAGVFLAQGASHTCLRWVRHAGLDEQKLNVLLVIGLTAGGLGAVLAGASGIRPCRKDLLVGAGIGLFNLIALFAVLSALGRFDAAVFFPTIACVTVVLDSASAHFFWKERLGTTAWIGVAIAVLAVILVLIRVGA
ncbi:MAG: hypothetical protein CMJ18_22850 [Phycisphaeraceae bacterium]|nr:hypothetical protein [Phycisphaeraceae bacterium]